MNLIIVFLASYLYLVIILVSVIAVVIDNKRVRMAILKLALLTLPIAFCIGNILSHLFYNPRPFVVEHVNPLIPHAANNGFPSDHTLLAISIASIVYVYHKRIGIFLFTLGLLVGSSRVLVLVHHPVDILTSVVIAIISTLISLKIIKKPKFGKHL